MDWWVLFKDYGGHVIALVALIQVWLIAVWKRLRRGKLSVYQTASIEIGFSTFGATVTLLGTLHAERRDVFVRSMIARATRLKDKAEHVFSWRAFRPRVINLGEPSIHGLEAAGSFLIPGEGVHQYNVFFGSSAFVEEYEAMFRHVRDAWNRLRTETLAEESPEDATGGTAQPLTR